MFGGALLFPLSDVLKLPLDSAPAWATFVPVEDSAVEKDAKEKGLAHWPRETHYRVQHAMQIGTVDELVADYREKLIRCFNTFAYKNKDDGWDVIPTFGEASLRKQTEMLERHDFNKDMTNYPFTVDPKHLNEREAWRNKQQGYWPRQSAYDRDFLKRLVGQWGGKRFTSPDEFGYGGVESPTDNPASIQKLIDALTVLRDDQHRAEDIAYAAKNGLTRDTLCELIKRFVERNGGKDPKVVRLTPGQIKEVRPFADFLVGEGKDDPNLSIGKLLGMDVEECAVGPILE